MVGRVLAPPPASARRPGTLVRCEGGGGSRPDWTEAAAGIGRGREQGEPRRRGDSKPRGGKDSGGDEPRGSKAGRGGKGPRRSPGQERISAEKRRKQREAATAAGAGKGGDARGLTRGRARREGRERAERYASLQDAYRSKGDERERVVQEGLILKQRGGTHTGPRRRARPGSDAAVTARNCDALRRHYEPSREPSVDGAPAGNRSRDLKYAGDGFRLVR